MLNYYFDVLKKYAVFNGRAGRKEFWMFVLIDFIVMIIISVIDHYAGWTDKSGNGPLNLIYNLATLLPRLGLAIRRLHDTGRSGWYLLLNLIPIIGWIITFVYAVQDSQAGTNKYGPNPKGINAPTPPPTPMPV